VVGLAIGVVAPHFKMLQADFQQALQNSQDPRYWVMFLGVFWIIKFIHECGHAFMCRRFGGEVHEMGIMFLVFVPTPYVDASTAWAFPSRWARMAVGAGGMIVELFVAALMCFVWVKTTPGIPIWGIPVHEVCSYVIFIASITTVIFNANPLLRYDGYYMLSDFLEIPNLQMRSREYLFGLIKRHVWRLKLQQPLPPPGQRVLLLIYGILSGIYRVFVGVAIILMVMYQIPILGALMAIGGLITWLVVPVVKLGRYLLIEPELHRKRGRAWITVGAVAATAVFLLGFIQWPVNVYAEGIADPLNRNVLHAKTPGFVTQIVAKPGQRLKKGDAVMILSDDELETKIVQQQSRIVGAEAQIRQASVLDQAQANALRPGLEALKDQLADLMRQKDEQTIRAEIDGQLVAPKIDEMMGKYLQKGEEVGTVATLDELEVHAVLDQRESELAFGKDLNSPDVLAEVRLVSRMDKTLYPSETMITAGAMETVWNPALTTLGGGELQADPRDPKGRTLQTPQFELRCKLANVVDEETGQPYYQPGQRAYMKLRLDKKPLAWQWTRRFFQLIQTRRQQKSQLAEGM
jgi:putative peptide zinc metalloprotease protein